MTDDQDARGVPSISGGSLREAELGTDQLGRSNVWV